jgi:hypothetical protein
MPFIGYLRLWMLGNQGISRMMLCIFNTGECNVRVTLVRMERECKRECKRFIGFQLIYSFVFFLHFACVILFWNSTVDWKRMNFCDDCSVLVSMHFIAAVMSFSSTELYTYSELCVVHNDMFHVLQLGVVYYKY